MLLCQLLGQVVVNTHVQLMSNMEAWHIAHTGSWRKRVVFVEQDSAFPHYHCKDKE
jgi:hypothetical protein